MSEFIGVVGVGNISLRHRRNLKTLFPSEKVISVSSSGRKLTDIPEYADCIAENCSELLAKKPRFVVVASPASHHCEHSLPFLKAKIPVLIEKPVTLTSQQLKEVKGAINGEVPFCAVAYCLRYMPGLIKLKGVVDSGVLGNIYNVFVEVGQFLPDWRSNTDYRKSVSASKALGGGVLFELSHELDYVQWLFGRLDVEYARSRNSSELDLDVEQIADLVLKSKQGTLVSVHLDFLQKKPVRKCTIVAEHGRLEFDLVANQLNFDTAIGREELLNQPSWDKNQMYLDMLKDFHEAISGQRGILASLDEAGDTIRLIERIRSVCN